MNKDQNNSRTPLSSFIVRHFSGGLQVLGLPLLASLALGLGACRGWQNDYSDSEAQFQQEDLLESGKRFVGKKITVKGKVTRVDISDPKNSWVYLEGGIRCHFGDLYVMAESNKVGDTILVDGFLVRCEEGDILLKPAIERDPKAPFSPENP